MSGSFLLIIILIVLLVIIISVISRNSSGNNPNNKNPYNQSDYNNNAGYNYGNYNAGQTNSNPSNGGSSFAQKMEQSAEQFNNYAKTGQANTTPQLKNNGCSIRNEGQNKCLCMRCNRPLEVSYGNKGGFCTYCNEWSYDRNGWTGSRSDSNMGLNLEDTLVKYPRVHVRISGKEYFPMLSVLPNGIFLQDSTGWNYAIPFAGLKASTASCGLAQQLTLIVEDNGNPTSVNIDMLGGSYDDLSGKDLQRINRLIMEG